ncbi:MAG: ATP-binding protein [Opitutaceae bacterium]|nr:ATP-binding protein [Opitutaceae bacterium]
MSFSIASFAAIVVTLVGVLILWANAGRAVNRAVFVSSFTVAAWLACSHMTGLSTDGLIWLRWTCAVGGFVPLTLWIVKKSILDDLDLTDRKWVWQNCGWFIFPLLASILPFTEWFIPSYSTEVQRLRGWAYPAYYVALIAYYIVLLRTAIKDLNTLIGARRQELLVWLGGGCVVAAIIYGLIALSAITNDPFYRRLQPLAVLVFYAGTGYAITSHRMFDARQILLVVVEKTALVTIVAVTAFGLNKLLLAVLSQTAALLLTTMGVLWIAAKSNAWLDRKFQFLPEGLAARQAAFATAQRETRLDTLERSFQQLLRGWGQAEHAVIISGTKGLLCGDGIELPGDHIVIQALKQLRWATPERLTRERITTERIAVRAFLSKHNLGVVVLEEGAVLSVLVGVAVGAARRPFTYPQVTQLMELASIMQAALERAHFSTKVQHAEQLATVGLLGASLAHEIRNPLVSIKTFVQLLPTHHHDPAFREKFFRLISGEVGRIDQLTEQLLDLASPRAYSAELIDLHPVLEAGVDLVAAKAAQKNVLFLTDFQAVPDRAYTDASAAKQVMLNLCFNAIQAAESHEGAGRWVRIGTRNTAVGIEMAVADSGPGVPAEIRPRLFQPFQTTKSTGFGLGLAICSDILSNLNASISVDPPVPGKGAIFRVTFPCQPLSS